MENCSKVTCIVTFKVIPGKKEELLQALKNLDRGCNKEEGWLGFRILRDLNDEHSVVMVEEYRSLEDFEKHFETPHIQHFMENIRPKTCVKIYHDKFVDVVSCVKPLATSLS